MLAKVISVMCFSSCILDIAITLVSILPCDAELPKLMTHKGVSKASAALEKFAFFDKAQAVLDSLGYALEMSVSRCRQTWWLSCPEQLTFFLEGGHVVLWASKILVERQKSTETPHQRQNQPQNQNNNRKYPKPNWWLLLQSVGTKALPPCSTTCRGPGTGKGRSNKPHCRALCIHGTNVTNPVRVLYQQLNLSQSVDLSCSNEKQLLWWILYFIFALGFLVWLLP